MSPPPTMTATTMTTTTTTTTTMTKTAMITRESQLWDLIETCGFREDIVATDNDNNDNDSNNDKGISAHGVFARTSRA